MTAPLMGDKVLRWSEAIVFTETAGADPKESPIIVEDSAGKRRYESLTAAFEKDDALNPSTRLGCNLVQGAYRDQ